MKIYDAFSLYLKYLLSLSITKPTKRLFSTDEEKDSISIPMFFPSMGVILAQASHCGELFVILQLNGLLKSIQYGYL